jgi:predicted RNase H-like HicB family nuclease
MRYAVVFERGLDGSIWGYAPDIPGATGAGDTLDEARASVATGIALWIETARERGVPVPAPKAPGSEFVEVPAA